MAILNFQKPDKVIMIESSDFEGRFEFRPLEPGYGLTVGNALRRVLLSSLEGFAITSAKIEGIEHEFTTIPGVVEDVTEIILNLKQIRFKRQIDEVDNELVSISISGQDKITAGDFQKFISGFQVLNSDQVICSLDPKVEIKLEITIDKGRGYVTSEENKSQSAQLGTIFVDSIFTPIKNVKYHVEDFRVEQKTDYEKLVFDIVTDGSISPQDALTDAAGNAAGTVAKAPIKGGGWTIAADIGLDYLSNDNDDSTYTGGEVATDVASLGLDVLTGDFLGAGMQL